MTAARVKIQALCRIVSTGGNFSGSSRDRATLTQAILAGQQGRVLNCFGTLFEVQQISSKEAGMVKISPEASERIRQFLEGREGNQSIRILMTEGGWRGPYLVMALDDQKEDDEVIAEGGATFLVEKSLLERVKPIRIGYTHSTLGSGFTIDSELMKDMKGVNVGCHEIYGSCRDLPR